MIIIKLSQNFNNICIYLAILPRHANNIDNIYLHAAVSPKWVIEPKNEAVLAGESVALHCQTTGSPTPQVTWLKQRGNESGQFCKMNKAKIPDF